MDDVEFMGVMELSKDTIFLDNGLFIIGYLLSYGYAVD